MVRMNVAVRRRRFRQRIKYMTNRPRLSVHRSLRYIYAQLIDQRTGDVIASYDSKRLIKENPDAAKLKGVEKARLVGKHLGEVILKEKKIDKIVFDRSGYRYHGQVKALAEGLREAGLNF